MNKSLSVYPVMFFETIGPIGLDNLNVGPWISGNFEENTPIKNIPFRLV